MDSTLIVNPGSSSKKYALYENGVEVFSALFERTEDGYARCVDVRGERQTCAGLEKSGYETALHDMLDSALQSGVIQKIEHITRVGIRIVAPGTFFATHRVIDGAYVRKLTTVRDFAPLHVPHQLAELSVLREAFPHARIVGVSDSAFHAGMPPEAKRYSIPAKDAAEFDLYRFGYHGLSVASIVRQLGKEGSIPPRAVVCHVGSGVSVTALRDGKSVDTTMGFAPTSGLMMGARAGEVDPSAFIYLVKRYGGDVEKAEKAVSQDGGIKGVLGNSDLRVALDRSSRGDPEALITISMFIGGIRKAIGAMSATLGGVDALILTGTAPERNPLVREHIFRDFEYLGLMLSREENEHLGARAGVVSAKGSGVVARVMHTRELEEIAHVASVL